MPSYKDPSSHTAVTRCLDVQECCAVNSPLFPVHNHAVGSDPADKQFVLLFCASAWARQQSQVASKPLLLRSASIHFSMVGAPRVVAPISPMERLSSHANLSARHGEGRSMLHVARLPIAREVEGCPVFSSTSQQSYHVRQKLEDKRNHVPFDDFNVIFVNKCHFQTVALKTNRRKLVFDWPSDRIRKLTQEKTKKPSSRTLRGAILNERRKVTVLGSCRLSTGNPLHVTFHSYVAHPCMLPGSLRHRPTPSPRSSFFVENPSQCSWTSSINPS